MSSSTSRKQVVQNTLWQWIVRWGLREGRISAQHHTASPWTEVQSVGRAGGPPTGVLLAYSPNFQVRDLNQIKGKCLGKEKVFC